uniref:Putative secreted peptide n=1 Tax=Anopheles braziliensis TaxID=58242 RepID=A0A2M3ZPC9_9DIPT
MHIPRPSISSYSFVAVLLTGSHGFCSHSSTAAKTPNKAENKCKVTRQYCSGDDAAAAAAVAALSLWCPRCPRDERTKRDGEDEKQGREWHSLSLFLVRPKHRNQSFLPSDPRDQFLLLWFL